MGKFVVSKPEDKMPSFAMRHMKNVSRSGTRELPSRASYARGGMIRHYDDGGQVDQGMQPQTGTFDTPTGSKIADVGNQVLGTIANGINSEIPGMQFVTDNAQNLTKKLTNALGFHDNTSSSIKLKESNPDAYWDQNEYYHSPNAYNRVDTALGKHFGNSGQDLINAKRAVYDFGRAKGNEMYLNKNIPEQYKNIVDEGLNNFVLEGSKAFAPNTLYDSEGNRM